MSIQLSSRRRKVAALGGATAALSGSLAIAHHSGGSSDRFYTVLGIVTGMVVGGIILAFRRSTSACR